MNLGIIGSGTMGSGIAQVAATSGCDVKVYDNSHDALSKCASNLENSISALVAKGKIDATEKTRILNNITYVSVLKDLSDSELVIEAIVENLEIKGKVFKELETYVSAASILATNTSSLSIASIAAKCQMPERVIGIHFFNPAPVMQLVEVIPAIQTSNEVLNKVTKTISEWKKVIAVAKDTPGFIVNRLARPFYGEALRIYEEGIADIATIDWSMKTIAGFRMGPFELMDFIGNDVNYIVTETIFTSFYFDPKVQTVLHSKTINGGRIYWQKVRQGFL